MKKMLAVLAALLTCGASAAPVALKNAGFDAVDKAARQPVGWSRHENWRGARVGMNGSGGFEFSCTKLEVTDIFKDLNLNIEEMDIYQAIRDYSDINIHVHLSDNNRRYPGNCGLDFEKIIQTFHDVGYDELFCTEVFQYPSMEECARRSIAYLAPIFEKVYGRKPRA